MDALHPYQTKDTVLIECLKFKCYAFYEYEYDEIDILLRKEEG